MSLNVNQIKQFASYVDNKKNGGNGNGYVDGNEISVFKKKVKTADRNVDVDSILDTYKKNKVTEEAKYDANGAAPATVEEAIIAAFTPNSALNKAESNKTQAQTINAGLENADSQWHWYNPFSWFNNNEEVLDYTSMVTKDNVLEVVAQGQGLEKIVDSEDDVRIQAGTQIINALIEAAAERQIDVSNIILLDNNGNYLVGRDVKKDGNDVAFASDALSEDNFIAVVTALKEKIESEISAANGENNNKLGTLTILADRIDADTTNGGNNNGYIDTAEEIKNLKQAAINYGIPMGKTLQEIRDNNADGVENTTELQKTVANLFDPNRPDKAGKNEEDLAADTSKAFKDGMNNKDENLIKIATSMVNEDNVMQVLNDNPELVEHLAKEYDGFWFWEDGNYKDYTNPILKSVIQVAKNNGINIDDIIMQNGDKYIIGPAATGAKAGEDATDGDYVASVIKAIQNRINEQLGNN